MNDVKVLAKKLASSRVANRINDIFSQTSFIMNQLQEWHDLRNKAQMGADPELADEQPQKRQETLDATEKRQPNLTEVREPAKKTHAAPASDKNKVEVWIPHQEVLHAELNAKMLDSSNGSLGESNDIRLKQHRIVRRNDPGPTSLSKNASFYLNSIKELFDSI